MEVLLEVQNEEVWLRFGDEAELRSILLRNPDEEFPINKPDVENTPQ